jgi:hypothetical protein
MAQNDMRRPIEEPEFNVRLWQYASFCPVLSVTTKTLTGAANG